MFHELGHVLELSMTRLETGKVITVLQKGETNAAFCLHHFISYSLKSNGSLILVTLQQSFAHYSNVAAKLGVNLSLAKQNGKVQCVDLMTQFKNMIIIDQDSQNCDMDENIIKGVYETIRDHVSNITGEVVIVIDDISLLMCIGFDPKLIAHFLQYLAILVKENNQKLSLVLGDRCFEHDSQSEWLSKSLHHKSDVVVSVAPLSSGFSKDVHGQVSNHLSIEINVSVSCVDFGVDALYYLQSQWLTLNRCY